MSQIDDLKREIRDLQSRVANVPLRTIGGGGSSDEVLRVAVLPPVPASGTRRVFWYSNATKVGGTGDDQVWQCSYPQTRWYPMDKPTVETGEPE
jgi:hypothetical protein